MKLNLRLLLISVVFGCSTMSYSFVNDDDPLKKFLEKLERYTYSHSQEKIHLHTDKPYYSIGDTIWFKSYIVNSERNQLSNLSKILYVELINEKDSIKKSLRLPVVSGLSWGDFTLTDSLAEGNYRLRAYTNWMRNFDEAYFFDKTIQIGNSLSSQLISDISYTFSKTGVKEEVTATLNYKTIEGLPLAAKEVFYNIVLDSRNVLKGKGITDNTGTLQVKFINAQPFLLKAGKITTRIKVDEKSFSTKTFPIKATSNDIDVQFFAESGSLINNVRCKVGFKTVAADGLSRKASGKIMNNNGDEIVAFTTEYAGMGNFTFTPLKDNTYTAIVKFDDGSEKKIPLPKAQDEGIVLAVTSPSAESVVVKIFSTITNFNPEEEFTLIGQSNGVVHYVGKSKLSNSVFAANISKKRFPAGIIHFTLFNSAYQPLAERLVFIRPENQLQLSLKTDKTSYATRQKVRLDLNSLDSIGKATQASFSVAVTNESQLPYDDINETTILSNFLLTSDLKGYVETPNYYFTDVSEAKNKALDNLMLTQGWRKFEWKRITSENFPVMAFLPETGINISGKVTNPTGSPSPGAKVTLLSSGGSGIVLDTLTDAQGRFNFDNLNINDSTRFIIQARNAKGKKNVSLEIDRVPPLLVNKNPQAASAEINVNRALLPYLVTRKGHFDQMRKNGLLRRSIVLSEVKVTSVKQKVKYSSNLNGPGNADAVITAQELLNCSNIIFCLQGRVSGLIIENGIPYLTRNMSFSGRVPMQIVIDGMFTDAAFLSSISVVDIETIEILKSIGNTAMYGMRGGGGVLIITTKRGENNLSPRSFASGMASYTPQGYYVSRMFYSPNYAEPEQNALPDLRTTIFWTPNVITDETGKGKIEFFTSDQPGTYKVVAEGLDLNGFLSRQVYRFTVQ